MPGVHEIYRKTYKTNVRIMVPWDTVDGALTPQWHDENVLNATALEAARIGRRRRRIWTQWL